MMACMKELTFCVGGEEDDVVKSWNVILDNWWCVSLGRAEGEVIASFWIPAEY
jgi:hypothetical protein